MALTDVRCRNAKPKEKPYKLSDSGGLYLYVSTTGAKSFRYKYRYERKEKLLTIGQYPKVSLKQARDRHELAVAALAAGRDPGEEKKVEKTAEVAATGMTFKLVATAWHTDQKALWSEKHAKDVLRSLDRDVFPKLGSKPIGSITRKEVLEVLRSIQDRDAVETAHRVRQRMSDIFLYGIDSSWCEDDPAAVRNALKPVKKGRFPAFTDLETARKLLRESEAMPGRPLTKLASRFLALTALRPGVVRYTPWSEFGDLDGDPIDWLISAERMKLGLERKEDETFDFIVPLSHQAMDVLRIAHTLSGRLPFVFPNARHPRRPMSENAIGYMYNRIPWVRGRHVPHGWRSTFSTKMNERAVVREEFGDRAIIDLMLAHLPDGVEGIYNRAMYLPRRRQLAQTWADMLLEGFAPAETLLLGPMR